MGDEKELQRLNLLFYRCLETLDMACMEGLWLQEDWVRCIHPGWDVLVGWETVRESWEQIFASTHWIRVAPTAVDIHVLGRTGIVACSENITTTSDGDLGMAVAQATNIFLRTREGWKMVVHHASPAPVVINQPLSGQVQ
jgi:ketosteroid isomerase-like protein